MPGALNILITATSIAGPADPDQTVCGGSTNDWCGVSLAALEVPVDEGSRIYLAAGAPLWAVDGTIPGAVVIWTLGAEGLADVDVQPHPTLEHSSLFGTSLTAADVGCDGVPELIVGAPGDDDGFDGSGAVWILGETTEIAAISPSRNAGLGRSTRSVGDLDGDGCAEVGVTAPGRSQGTVFLLDVAGPELEVGELSSQGSRGFGSSLGGGDLNGDGISDVSVGHSAENAVYTWLGSPEGEANWSVSGEPESAFGAAVSADGDLNGDGYTDLVVGAPDEDASGAAIIYTGGASDPEYFLTVSGGERYDGFAATVLTVPDLNGDGYDDLAVGVPEASDISEGAGALFIYYGGESELISGDAVTPPEWPRYPYAFGQSLLAIDAPEFGGLVAGAPGNTEFGDVAGSVWTIATCPDSDLDGLCFDEDCDDDDASVGKAAEEAYADQDDDGYGVGEPLVVCRLSEGLAADEGDCDDNDPFTFPGAAEHDSETACMTDRDADGYGRAIAGPDAIDGTDCDDSDHTVSPDASEVCGDRIDNDCNGRGGVTTDEDGDGLLPLVEDLYGADPCNVDTDGDGLDDGDEVGLRTDPASADTDRDGLSDQEEFAIHGTDPRDPDSDQDGLCDGEEVAKGTDPLSPDSDGDGILDGKDSSPMSATRCSTLPGSANTLYVVGVLLLGRLRRRKVTNGA